MASSQEHRELAEKDLAKFAAAMDVANDARQREALDDEAFEEQTFKAVKYGVGALTHALLAMTGSSEDS